MTKEEQPDEPELTREELARQIAEQLPDRVAMSLIDANVAIPIDPAIAADLLAEESLAGDAEPEQETGSEGGDGHA